MTDVVSASPSALLLPLLCLALYNAGMHDILASWLRLKPSSTSPSHHWTVKILPLLSQLLIRAL
jgi:hypothetical protein